MTGAVNLWARWKDLSATDPLLIADVVAVDSGRCVVRYPGGAGGVVYGAGTISGRVFIQSGKVIGDAPTLPLVVDTV